MPRRDFEAILRDRARSTYDALSERDRADVDALINLVELDSFVDDVQKFKLLVPPLVLTAYDNGIWRITNRIVTGAIEILSIECNS